MKRTTILIGAGAAVELKTTSVVPSTWSMTSESLQNNISNIDSDGTKLLNDVYNALCANCNPLLVPNQSYGSVHFEILFHVLEMLSTMRMAEIRKFSIDAPFEGLIQNLKINFDTKDIFPATRHLLDTIWHIVRAYNDVLPDNSNDWYTNFWRKFGDESDIFNLNYDATIEQSISRYEDGFESTGEQSFYKFNIRKLLDNASHLTTINHMHGCIYYGRDSYKDPNTDVYDYEPYDLYKWKDLDRAYDRWIGSVSGNQTTQNGQEIVQGPLITGLSKTEKTTCLPYDIYRYNLQRSIIRNHPLLIVGYSFGDKYINHMLNRMNQLHGNGKRVVLIAFWGIQEWARNELGEQLTNNNLSPRIFEQYIASNKVANDEILFIKRMAGYDYDIWNHFNKLSLSEPMVSDNHQLMLVIGGFKQAVNNHEIEIIAYLNS